MEGIIIRQYKKDDRSSIRDIAWDTAFIGKSANIFFDGEEILTDFLTKYFTDYEPDSCFVALNSRSEIVGYLLGTKNTVSLRRIFSFKIFPRLLISAIIKGTFLRKKNMLFILHCLNSILRQEFKMPDFSKEYPATLHINLKESWRDLKIGSRLITVYLDYLAKAKIPGIYLATMSNKAAEFFSKQGFNLLHKGHRTYFRYILQKDVSVYIYGKRL